ncbi:WXG100 family type VII secretion target [Pseudobutyrivibrio sp.]|uniref:WXG100 family type VII secretion target n=1 Tax=Pseudobutyrivibrio sp. TaxID=2014367 RepID=UPI0025CCF0B3|nr:WXG100 family type VII secretion target [Pseudobutyrivibrio sp.]MBR5649636.1 WXG100 family type VII secretion target [Pseudobutyrivibrio sp.]
MGDINANIFGEVDEMAATSNSLSTFSESLRDELDAIQAVVNEVAGATFGDASPQLLEVYTQLDADLRAYVAELANIGSNVEITASNLAEIDQMAQQSITYELG